MIKKLKSNKLTIVLLFLCFIIILSPATYSKSCLNGLSLWATKLFPVLFPFFVLTRLILINSSNDETKLDKYFNKLYKTPTGSLKLFLLSFLCGYPMGAKLIATKYENNEITQNDARKLLSFCSVSGPMFMIGTVGVSIFMSFKAGFIILLANFLAAMLNGILYRGKTYSNIKNNRHIKNSSNLSDIVFDSMISILMVGAFICLSFIIIDILSNLKILKIISTTICSVFNINHHQSLVDNIVIGLLEITRGISEIGNLNLGLNLKTIIASGLIGFGGISVIFQSFAFIDKIKIKPQYIILQKFTQAVFCIIFAIILTVLFPFA